MRYVVIGAGGVGGTIGGLLQLAGAEVVVVARGAHGAAIAADGLLLRRPDGDRRVPLSVVASVPELRLRPDDVLVLTVQSQHTAGVLADLAALAVDGERATEVLPLCCAQNGVTNEDEALRVCPAVHAVTVNLPATRLEPGVVSAEASPIAGVLTLGLATGGSDDVDVTVSADLEAAGFRAPVVDDAMGWKRTKLLGNLANALDGLVGSDLDASDEARFRELHDHAMAEGRAVFAAAGLPVVDQQRWRANTAGYRALPIGGVERQGGSTWQTLARGSTAVETDLLNGEVVRLARLHGVPAPVNAMLQRELARLVRDGGAPGSVSLATLLPSLR